MPHGQAASSSGVHPPVGVTPPQPVPFDASFGIAPGDHRPVLAQRPEGRARGREALHAQQLGLHLTGGPVGRRVGPCR